MNYKLRNGKKYEVKNFSKYLLHVKTIKKTIKTIKTVLKLPGWLIYEKYKFVSLKKFNVISIKESKGNESRK